MNQLYKFYKFLLFFVRALSGFACAGVFILVGFKYHPAIGLLLLFIAICAGWFFIQASKTKKNKADPATDI